MHRPIAVVFTCLAVIIVPGQTPKTPPAAPAVAPPKIIGRPSGAEFKVPKGFTVEEFASGFERPRFMALGPSGEILLSDFVPNGSVYVLEGKERKTLLRGLDRPYGIAFWKNYLYVAETTSLKRYKYDAKAKTAGPGEEIVPMKDFGKGHVTRTVSFNRKMDKMLLAVGSSGNLVLGDPPMRAAINRYNPDGSGHEIFASGLRNPVGLRFYPGSDELWATVEERDGLGDDLVPDYFTHVRQGAFYGWPYAYLGPNLDPRITEKRPDLVDKSVIPDVILETHCAVLDFIFYNGKQFPAEYRGGAFLANHGSASRSHRVGYSITFVPFAQGKPSGKPRDFLTGFLLDPDKPEVWGRPVGLLEMPDGSMMLSDDGAKKLWHIRYK
jgi:glucose/arabinose dehydrogenase